MTSAASARRIEPQPPRAPTASRPVVTICCITYNHERFIARALDGFLAQRTDFPVEIIVHDDHSTDATPRIIRDYQERHPDRIRTVLRRQNQYALGRRITPMFSAWLDSEFAALCEGDDYWTDPEKLQRQVDYLRTHPAAAGTFHDTTVVDGDDQLLESSYFHSEQSRFTQQDILASLLSREPTCSLVFRSDVLTRPLPSWYLRRPSDLYLDLLITAHGELHFLPRNMGAYRRHQSGVWSGQRAANQILELIFRLQLLEEDPGFQDRYGALLRAKIDELRRHLFTREDFTAETQRLTAIVTDQEKFIGDLRTQVAARQTDSDALRAQLEQLGHTTHDQTAYIQRLEQLRDTATADLATARAAAARHLATLTDQEKFIFDLRTQVAARQADSDALRAQLEQLGRTTHDQAAYIQRLEQLRDTATADLATARAAATRHLATLADQEKFIVDLRTQVAARQTDSDALRAQLEQLGRTTHDQAAYIQRLEQLRDTAAADLATAHAAASRHLATVAEQQVFLVQLQSRVATLQTEEEARQNGLTALQKTLGASQIEGERRSAVVAEQDRYIAGLQQQLSETKAQLARLGPELTTAYATIREQTDYIAALRRTPAPAAAISP